MRVNDSQAYSKMDVTSRCLRHPELERSMFVLICDRRHCPCGWSPRARLLVVGDVAGFFFLRGGGGS